MTPAEYDAIKVAWQAITYGIQDVPVQMCMVWFPPGERFGVVEVTKVRGRKPTVTLWLTPRENTVTITNGGPGLTAAEAIDLIRERVTAPATKVKRTPGEERAIGIRAENECDRQVFDELFHHGKGTAKQVAARLKKRKVKFTEAQVQDAMNGWVARGWCAVTGKTTHLSQAAVEHLR